MAAGRSSSTIATDEAGVAAVVGAALLLALLVSVYAHELREQLPVHGATADEEWKSAATRAFTEIAAASGRPEPTRLLLPAAPEPKPVRSFMGPEVRPAPSGGTLSFDAACARVDAAHVDPTGATVADLVNVNLSCLRLDLHTSYVADMSLRVESGALIRVQGRDAVVVHGPPFEVEKLNESLVRLRHGWPTYYGSTGTTSAGAAAVPLELTPVAPATDAALATMPEDPNAVESSWSLRTRYPDAWRAWYDARFEAAGLVDLRPLPAAGESDADYAVACVPVDCSVGADGFGRVDVSLQGPRTDMPDLIVILDAMAHRLSLG